MNAVGIIAEYNPLHNGHKYLLEEAQRIAGGDAVVVAMSGNYVQRGEPAIIDKWKRAATAVACGADLVIEIPVFYCLGNAKQYAKAGVGLLEGTGCVDRLVFGSESADIHRLKKIAERLNNHSEEIDALIKNSSQGLSYPQARENMYKVLFRNDPELELDIKSLNSSNDILGIEYIRACSKLEPVAVKRTAVKHDEAYIKDSSVQSATAIREMLKSDEDISSYVPYNSFEAINGSHLMSTDDYFDVIKYAILSTTAESIDDCPSGGEGLGNKLKQSVSKANTYDELVQLVKSKKYTYTRLSRLLMQIALGISREKYGDIGISYIRVLAMNDKGRELLAGIRNNESGSYPIITNLSKDAEKLDASGSALAELDVHGSDIYNMLAGRDVHDYSDYRIHPVII